MFYPDELCRRSYPQTSHAFSKKNDFICKLQMLEKRIGQISFPQRKYQHRSLLSKTIRYVKHYLFRSLMNKKTFIQKGWLYLENNHPHLGDKADKMEVIKNNLYYLKDYATLKNNPAWEIDINNHMDIINIYWHSKKEVEKKEKLHSYLTFFEEEIKRLEASSLPVEG
jgi:hypothetical protein